MFYLSQYKTVHHVNYVYFMLQFYHFINQSSAFKIVSKDR